MAGYHEDDSEESDEEKEEERRFEQQNDIQNITINRKNSYRALNIK